MDTNVNNLLALLFSITMIGVCSCGTPKDLEYRNYKNFGIEKLGFSNTALKLDLEYFNPNNFGLQLKRADLDIFINDNLLGHSSSDTLISIPRKSAFTLPIKFDLNMQNMYKNAWNTLAGNEVTVKVTGSVKVGKANVFMSMPVKYEGKQKFSLFQ